MGLVEGHRFSSQTTSKKRRETISLFRFLFFYGLEKRYLTTEDLIKRKENLEEVVNGWQISFGR